LPLLLALLAGCARANTPVPATPTLDGALNIRAPATVPAGAAVPVEVERVEAPDGLVVALVAQGSYGARVYQAAFARGVARLQLPGEDTRESGTVALIATSGAARGEASVEILPGPPADAVTPLVGPRSIVADGQHQTMTVAVPFDDYGNPVAEGTPVEFRALHPGERLERQTGVVSHLVAWRRIVSGTRAGRTTVTAIARDAHGPDATYTEVPSWPAPFDLSASPADVPADGRQLVTLRTDVIRDRFGSAMLDGTLVTFVADLPGSEPRFIPAYTIDGAAEAQLQAPSAPATVTVRATLYGVESRPLRIAFAPGPAVGSFPMAAQVNARDGFVVITAGPLLGALGQFVPDGTPVQFRLTGPGGAVRAIPGQAEKGRARTELRLAELTPGAYAVEMTVGAGRGTTAFLAP
jgi:hypothetical protein